MVIDLNATDRFLWRNKATIFSVRELYQLMDESLSSIPRLPSVWKLRSPLKVRDFHGYLYTSALLPSFKERSGGMMMRLSVLSAVWGIRVWITWWFPAPILLSVAHYLILGLHPAFNSVQNVGVLKAKGRADSIKIETSHPLTYTCSRLLEHLEREEWSHHSWQ